MTTKSSQDVLVEYYKNMAFMKILYFHLLYLQQRYVKTSKKPIRTKYHQHRNSTRVVRSVIVQSSFFATYGVFT